MLSRRYEDIKNNTDVVIRFMVDNFDACYRDHPFLDNLILLNDKTWLIVSSTSDEGVVLYDGVAYERDEFIQELDNLNSGILIFKQTNTTQLQIYLIDDIFMLKQYKYGIFLNWDSVEKIKRFSEVGVVLDSELIGFCDSRKNSFEGSHYRPIANVKSLFSL